MSSIHHFGPVPSDRIHDPRKMPGNPVRLSAQDRRHLLSHLSRCNIEKQSFLAHVLRHKIASSQSFDGVIPCEVVTGGSQIIYSIGGGPAQSGLLSHHARTGADSGVIPVSSLLGATLIGMRVGQRAPLLCEDGAIDWLSVLGVRLPA